MQASWSCGWPGVGCCCHALLCRCRTASASTGVQCGCSQGLGMTTHRLALSAGPFLLATSCARSAKQQTQHRQALLLLHLLAGLIWLRCLQLMMVSVFSEGRFGISAQQALPADCAYRRSWHRLNACVVVASQVADGVSTASVAHHRVPMITRFISLASTQR